MGCVWPVVLKVADVSQEHTASTTQKAKNSHCHENHKPHRLPGLIKAAYKIIHNQHDYWNKLWQTQMYLTYEKKNIMHFTNKERLSDLGWGFQQKWDQW
jgi:hypothetical protein